MRNLFILALILFASCEDTHTEKQRTCFKMILSDALPVQFWLDGCETFNQKIVDGINQVCFCQPFNCDDEIKIQFTDTQPLQSYNLNIVDENDSSILVLPFSKQSYGSPVNLQFSNTEFNTGTLGWSNLPGSGGTRASFNWQVPGYAFADGTANSAQNSSYFAVQTNNAGGWPPGIYTVSIRAKNNSSGASNGLGVSPFGMMDITSQTSLTVLFSDASFPNDNTFYTRTITFQTTQFWNYIAFPFTRQGGGGSFTIKAYIDSISLTSYPLVYTNFIMSLSFVPQDYDICDEKIALQIFASVGTPDELLAYSDCIDIKSDHDESILINYSNHRNFAGLDYSDISPDPDFNIRIPAVFFQERFPQEQEVIELSDNREIQLDSQIKVERYLETGAMPFYMHKKLIEILMHQFVIIDGMYWVKGNAYEFAENSNKRYPLRMGNIWLTQQDYIARNIL